MAKQLGADLFVISPAVEKVCLNYGKPDQKDLERMDSTQAKQYIEEGHFAPGSMLPKIQAVVDFATSCDSEGIITNPANLYDAVNGGKGTHIVR